MRIICTFMIIFLSYITLTSQEIEKPDTLNAWHFFGKGSATFSQASFINWATGGENSLSLNGESLWSADYKSNNIFWENDLILAYGGIKQGKLKYRKTDDKFEINSKFGYLAVNNWYYSVLVNLKSQFSSGYDTIVTKTLQSNFMAPAYLTLAGGFNYTSNKIFTLFIGPLSGRTTFVLNDTLSNRGTYGLEAGQHIRNEFGGTIKATLNKDIMKNINMLSRLILFSNYIENPEKIRVDWQTLFTMKINDVFSTNLNIHILYDKDVTSQIQVKEILGVGIVYKFSR